MLSCLRSDDAFDLLTPWRVGRIDVVQDRIRRGIALKQKSSEAWPDRPMVDIGG